VRFDLAQEGRLVIAATQFLTRLPVPAVRFEPDWLPRSAKFFPLVGIGIGLVAAATLLLASRVWPDPIPAILAVSAALLLTGALHEDGLADSADGLGGASREARLAIMKDSRLGTYGVLALALVLVLRIAALTALPLWTAAVSLIAAHAASRLAAIALMWRASYAGDRDAAKVVHATDRPRPGEVAMAILIGLAPLLALPAGRAVAATLLAAGVGIVVAVRLCRGLGGYTGDVLGAVVASVETAFLLGAAMVMNR
jgi:adenosylcobinamide-GDP ribazoletransferase